MCGITGIVSAKKNSKDFLLSTISNMNQVISHRGPDDEGCYFAENYSLALGHKRLSILDLSPNGSQPMYSSCKRYVIVFNGEIYNFLELKKTLSEFTFRGGSDTEVLINHISKYGITETLRRVKGQFAFAVLDKKNSSLTMARDCLGEKPLYYSYSNGYFLFSSELTSIRRSNLINLQLNEESIDNFLNFSYIPSPQTIYKGIQKLKPGHFIKLNLNSISEIEQVDYYGLQKKYLDKPMSQVNKSQQDYISELNELLQNSVNSQLICDVPIGGLLSGGIDSSIICSFANELIRGKLNTYTIGFQESAFDESLHAKRIAKHIGSNHHEMILSPAEIVNEIPRIINRYDEPFADASQIPTFFVMKYASSSVKVVLSGDGGDELFGGYNRYLHVERVWRYLRFIPSVFKPYLSYLSELMPSNKLDAINFFGMTQIGSKLDKVLLKSSQVKSKYDVFNSMIREKLPKEFVSNINSNHPYLDHRNFWPNTKCFKSDMMLIDMLTYLPDDILTKVDRSSMLNSIESRAPFLDKDIIDFSINLPLSLKVASGKTKIILREILKQKLPIKLFERPKMGFSIPVSKWLQEDLKDWAHAVFQNPVYFEKNLLLDSYNNFLSGKISHTLLWNIIALESWLQENNS